MDIDITVNDSVVTEVKNDLNRRSMLGILKYNTTLEANNKDNYINHAYEESLDHSLYLKKLLMQKDNITDLVKKYPNDNDLGKEIRKIYVQN